jgi:cyclopropane-fatty-acyl-phospholipid synthase
VTLAPSRTPATAWPGLDTVPTGLRTAISAHVARRLFEAAVNRLDVTVLVEDPDRTRSLGRGGPVMTVHRPAEFFTRIGRHQLIGFGEAYLTGSWDAEDVSGFLTVLAAELPTLVPRSLQNLRATVVARPPRMHRNSQRNTRDNIAHHYDLSNDLFGLFLDPTLSYSSALFDAEVLSTSGHRQAVAPVQGADLYAGQLRKIDRLLDEARVGQDSRVLEIGTGWGEAAIRAARRGARVTTLTLSVEQAGLARVRAEQAGVSDRITIDVRDYREAVGEYDSVISIEMIEAVGELFWPEYFATVDRLLAPGGRFGLQSITMPHHRLRATKDNYTWIHKYIFPGGLIPSLEAIDATLAGHTSMEVVERRSIGLDYAETLRRWRATFLVREPEVRAIGFDETFVRMWDFYLAYSEAGFAARYLDDFQLGIARR